MNGQHPDSETLISMFRDWLADEDQSLQLDDFAEPVGLYQLVEALTALRQEVKLETKGVRSLHTQTEESLQTLKRALDQLEAAQANQDQSVLPYIEVLMEQDEALERCGRVISQICSRARREAQLQMKSAFDAYVRQQPWWRLLLRRKLYSSIAELAADAAGNHVHEAIRGIEEGFELICRRVHRSLAKFHIERIVTEGRSFDPHEMAAVDVVETDDVPAGYVVQEVRAGYRFKGQPVRFAEVRVAKRKATPANEETSDSTVEED